MLREPFEALDDDPRLIAECLARPIAVDRLPAEQGWLDAAPVEASSFTPDGAAYAPNSTRFQPGIAREPHPPYALGILALGEKPPNAARG